MEKDERPRQRDRAATENALLEAASVEFSAKGYEGTTTKEIASKAGCAEALIHRYFQSKEGLFLALIKKHKDEQISRDFEAMPIVDSMYEEARQILRSRIHHLRESCSIVRIAIRRVMLDPSFKKEFDAIGGRQKVLKALEDRFRTYQRTGKMRADVDPAIAAEMISSLGFQLGFVRKEVFAMSDTGLDVIADHFAKIFADGVTSQ